jgi:gamma-glutamyltranspeptidase/glutathione hydrolase
VLALEDLAGYRPVERAPLEGRYRGHRILTFPPPSSGGVVLLQMLGMLERFDIATAGPGSSASVHLTVEAARRAFADRARWLGDPDHSDVPVAALLAPDYLAGRAATIRLERATPSAEIAPGGVAEMVGSPEDTLHFSIGDASGGALALTTTLNTSYGSGLVARGTGILLNNEMDDFALAPGVPDTYGLLGSGANAVAGGKRPLSSMCPTIVEARAAGARPLLVLGSPGGSRIPTAVLQVLVNVVDHGMPLQEAVDAPRIHHQGWPDELRYEPRGLPEDVVSALRERGHVLLESHDSFGSVNAVGTAGGSTWLGAADPRRTGTAAAY